MSELERFRRFFEEILGLTLEPFQELIAGEVFSDRREAVILLPRGQGKSTLLAAISLWHLLSAKDPRIAIGAASREQAAVLFDIARGMASHPLIAPRVELTRREIRTPAGWLKVVASDGPKQHGLILSLAIVDELHAHRDAELYLALRTGLLKRRDSRIVTISTAASEEDSPLGELRRRALDLPEVRAEGSFTEAYGPNLAFMEWSLPEATSIDDMSAVKTANPASWITEGDLAEQREAVHELAFRRYHAGQWVAGIDSAISPTEWARCARRGSEIPEGADGVVVGIDLGWRWDSTAIVPIHRDGETIQVHTPAILIPPRDGTSLDSEEVFAACEEMAERWPGLTYVIDPHADGEQLAQRLDRELHARVLTHSQQVRPMADAAAQLAAAVREGWLEHPDDPELNRHVLAASAKFHGGISWRLVKPAGSKALIDGVIALAMAVRVLASINPDSPELEQVRGPSTSLSIAGH